MSTRTFEGVNLEALLSLIQDWYARSSLDEKAFVAERLYLACVRNPADEECAFVFIAWLYLCIAEFIRWATDLSSPIEKFLEPLCARTTQDEWNSLGEAIHSLSKALRDCPEYYSVACHWFTCWGGVAVSPLFRRKTSAKRKSGKLSRKYKPHKPHKRAGRPREPLITHAAQLKNKYERQAKKDYERLVRKSGPPTCSLEDLIWRRVFTHPVLKAHLAKFSVMKEKDLNPGQRSRSMERTRIRLAVKQRERNERDAPVVG